MAVKEFGVRHQRRHLSNESYRLLSHRVSVSYVGFDHFSEWLFHALQEYKYAGYNQTFIKQRIQCTITLKDARPPDIDFQ